MEKITKKIKKNCREMVLNFDMDIDTIGGQPVLIYDHKTTLNHP